MLERAKGIEPSYEAWENKSHEIFAPSPRAIIKAITQNLKQLMAFDTETRTNHRSALVVQPLYSTTSIHEETCCSLTSLDS